MANVVGKAKTKAAINNKPTQGTHERLYKAIEIVNLRPSIIFIGTSRVRMGLDPSFYTQVHSEPIFNAAVSSANMNEMLLYFKHTLENQPDLKQVVVGIDFYVFNRNLPNRVDFPSQQIGKKNITYQSFVETSASLDALENTIRTVKGNLGKPAPSFFEPNGKTSELTLQNTYGKIVDLKGFTSINRFNINNKESYASYEISQERINDFRELVDICREKNIDIKVFISPSHATDMEAIRVSGKWKDFEDMKRLLCTITPIWDFSGYNSITTEPVGQERQYYWDSSHYKKEVGNMILSKLSGIKGNSPDDFGVIITPENVEKHLVAVRASRDIWAKDNLDIVNYVQSLRESNL